MTGIHYEVTVLLKSGRISGPIAVDADVLNLLISGSPPGEWMRIRTVVEQNRLGEAMQEDRRRW